MATTKKYLDEDGLVQLVGKIKKAVNDADYSHGVTDIAGITTTPTYANDLNATATSRSATFTVNGSSDTFTVYDTTYGDASTTKDGLMTHEDKTKLDGIATGAEVNVQSDWSQTTTTADDYIKNKPTFKTINNTAITGTGNISVQAPLTFDDVPTASSNNPVKSGGVKTAVDAAAKTVKQTEATGSSPISAVFAGTTDSNNVGEVATASDIKYNPSTRETIIGMNSAVGSSSSTTFTFKDAELLFGNGGAKINATSYTGRATGTETYLARATESLDEGANNIGYYNDAEDYATTVAVALNDIYDKIGGGGDESLTTRVTALENGKADKTAAVGSITGTTGGNETGNYAMVSGTTGTFAYYNNKVAQESDTSTTSFIPLLLSSGATPTSPAGAKYNSNVKFKPSTRELQVVGETSVSGGATRAEVISFKDGVITITSGSGGIASSSTITSVNYSGTAAKATADGNGNNIANTYATQAALSELSQKWTGQFIVVKQTGDTASIYTALNNILDDIEAGNTPSATDLAVLDYGYIYLLSDSSASSPNVFNEYIKVKTGTTTETVEKIGTTDAGVDVVSLTTAEINTIWSTTAAAS